MEVFSPSLETGKRGTSSGGFYPEPRNEKVKKVRGTFLASCLKLRKRGNIMKAIGTQMLQTERLILRRFVESDAEAMFQNWVASYANPHYFKWAICLKEKPEQVIGDISIVEMNEDDSCCEIGYILGKNYWGCGMMTEALKAVLDFCFTRAGFQKVKARYASLNPASGRVMEKAGMIYLKTIANGVERKDYVADLIYYQIKKN